MAEEPEEVLPQHGLSSAARIEEVAAELSVDEEHHERRGERWIGAEDEDAGDERHPHEERHA
jgi:hypothetical protein